MNPAPTPRPAQEPAERRAAAMFERDAASRGLGISIHDVAPGRAAARLTVTEAMINGHGICHGGYVFLLADTAFACACNTYDTPAVAQACDIAFLRPARLGEELLAVATERVRQGRSGIYDVTVTRSGEVIAEFRGRSRSVPDPAR